MTTARNISAARGLLDRFSSAAAECGRHTAIRSAVVVVLAVVASSLASTLVSAAPAIAQPDGKRVARSPARPALPVKRGEASRLPRNVPVPILMYHVIADPPSGAPYPELYVRAADFGGQMRWLEIHGYTAVTLRAVWDHWHGRGSLPRRPVVVSFDDGYRSTAQWAFPSMRDRRWPGVVNLAVKNLRVAGGLSNRQVRRLITAGWEIDAHTLTHPDLTAVDDRQLAHEVAGSRRELQRRFGTPVDFFCYPAGRYDARVVAAVEAAGFLGATTTVDGLANPTDPFELHRIRVSRSDGVSGFAAKLARLTDDAAARH